MEILFKSLAAVFVLVAAYFLWTDGLSDFAFVAGVFAVASGFLSYRFRLKARIKKLEESEEILSE